MCATCGCSDGSKAAVSEAGDPHEHHHHDHEHGHDHHHEHDGVPHLHGQARVIQLEQDVLAKNARLAARNRGWFEGRDIAAINVMASPGAGLPLSLRRSSLHSPASIWAHIMSATSWAAQRQPCLRPGWCGLFTLKTPGSTGF